MRPASSILPELLKTKTDKPIKKRHIPTPPKILSRSERFVQFVKRYSTRLWGGYYSILLIAAFLTGVIVERTGLAKNIMDYVRTQQALETRPSQPIDSSSFQLDAGPGMVAVIRFPNGKRVGDSAEGIRYLEVGNVSLTRTVIETTQTTTHSWGMTALTPPNGSYSIDFSSKTAGSYPYTFTAYDSTGTTKITQSGAVTIKPYEHHIYSLEYHKEDLDRIRFDFIKIDLPNF